MQSDYHFLEDVLHTVDGGKRLLRNVGASATTQQAQGNKQPLHEKGDEDTVGVPLHPILKISQVLDDDEDEEPQPKRLRTTNNNNNKWQRLVQQAELRGTTLMLMPPGMQRHATNTTWYHHKTDTIHWKVDLNISTSNDETSRVVSIPKLDENASIAEEVKKAWPEYTLDGHHLLIKRLPCPSNKPRYVELDNSETTLKMALRDQTIIEYPMIEVVPTQALSIFPRSIEEI